MFFRRRRDEEKEAAAQPKVPDERPTPGASATLSNIGPEHRPAEAFDYEASDTPTGTTSDEGLRGKPSRGSRHDLP